MEIIGLSKNMNFSVERKVHKIAPKCSDLAGVKSIEIFELI